MPSSSIALYPLSSAVVLLSFAVSFVSSVYPVCYRLLATWCCVLSCAVFSVSPEEEEEKGEGGGSRFRFQCQM